MNTLHKVTIIFILLVFMMFDCACEEIAGVPPEGDPQFTPVIGVIVIGSVIIFTAMAYYSDSRRKK